MPTRAEQPVAVTSDATDAWRSFVFRSLFGGRRRPGLHSAQLRAVLLDAMEHPDRYPPLTIRVSGDAVNFVCRNPEQQRDAVNRTFGGGL